MQGHFLRGNWCEPLCLTLDVQFCKRQTSCTRVAPNLNHLYHSRVDHPSLDGQLKLCQRPCSDSFGDKKENQISQGTKKSGSGQSKCSRGQDRSPGRTHPLGAEDAHVCGEGGDEIPLPAPVDHACTSGVYRPESRETVLSTATLSVESS